MLAFVIRRLLTLIPVLVGVTLVIFSLSYISLGDPVRAMMGQRGDPEVIAQIRRDYGLDQPLHVQYARYIGRLLHGDLGRSYRQHRRVTDLMWERLPATLRLAAAAMLIAVVFGCTAGILAAIKPNSWIDRLVMVLALLGISTPVFWSAMMLILLFGSVLRWFPISGYGSGNVWYLILPAVTLGALQTGYIARMTRSSLLDVLRQDYMQTARAKGLRDIIVLCKHGLKNAAIPVVTVIGISFADLLTGAPLTEMIFAWPGIGRLMVNAVANRDFPVVMGCTLVFALVYALANLCVDLLYAYLDPRIRYDRED
ncbi:MAG: ABC transporter permease [Candidatus Tectomicrobia bacterium]|nr:ABC transporter permease [Candidatus Tectomicrobia bacterium]